MSDSKTFSALEKIDNCKKSVRLSREECEELVSYIKMLQNARQSTAIRADRAVSMVERFKELAFTFVQGFRVDSFGALPNGNNYNGIDEGEVRGNELLLELEQRYDALVTEWKEQK